jgi:hypothetical protein
MGSVSQGWVLIGHQEWKSITEKLSGTAVFGTVRTVVCGRTAGETPPPTRFKLNLKESHMRTFLRLIVFCFLLGNTNSLWAAGLGSSYAEFEREWNKGYREVFQLSEGMKEVHVGFHDRRCLSYGDGFYAFSRRIGIINGNTNGLFGAPDKTLPTKTQFFQGIKHMIPSDSKLISKYRRKRGYVTETFIFKSSSLAQM